MEISLSEPDSSNLGVRVARAKINIAPLLDSALGFCEDHRVDLLIVRIPAERLEIVRYLSGMGAYLCDTLSYYAIDTRKVPGPLVLVPSTREFRPEDEPAILEIARNAFSSFSGHYHQDPRIKPEQANRAYEDWARRSCHDKALANHILVAEREGKVVGFVTLQVQGGGDGEIVLGGVLPEWQGGGIYRGMLEDGINWLSANGAPRVLVSTPIHNRAVRKVWCRLGLEPLKEYHTLHLWFPDWRRGGV